MKDMKNKRHKEHEKELEKNEQQKYYQQQSFAFQFNIYMTEYIYIFVFKGNPNNMTVYSVENRDFQGAWRRAESKRRLESSYSSCV